MADELKQVMVLIGPYRDHLLTMPAGEADAAIAAHWAVDRHPPPPPPPPAERKEGVYQSADESHPPLTEDERRAALEAAQTWAQAQWDAAQAIAEPRELAPGETPGEGYVTRGTRTKR